MKHLFGLLMLIGLFMACGDSKQDKKETSAVVEATAMEQHRPHYHFTPKEKWMNDPNGMVYYDGEYHLFYQHYPDSTVWGPMHWGHAISRDLVHWAHLPIALYPDSLGLIFSGSAVVDWKNSSGFGDPASKEPPLVAMFTYHDMAAEKAGRTDFQYQGIAYSQDKGRTWTKYEGNPVIPNPGIRDFRDTKVIWDEAHHQWLMVLAAWDHIQFYRSDDLKKWEHLSNFGKEWGVHTGVWECPDLFPLQVEGTDTQQWVLLVSLNPGSPNGGSGTQYFIGDFNGREFVLDDTFAKDVAPKAGQSPKGETTEQGVWLDYGRDNYAGVTWSDIPKSDGRRLFLGWMSNWQYANVVPTEKWRSAMTIPRQLLLKQSAAGLRLFSSPVREMEALRGKTYALEPSALEGELELTDKLGFSPAVMEAVLELELPENSRANVGLALSNSNGEVYKIGFNAAQTAYFSDRRASGKKAFSDAFAEKVHWAPAGEGRNRIKMQFYFDVASCELFADEGATVLTDIFFPNEDYTQVKIFSENGAVKILNAQFWALQ